MRYLIASVFALVCNSAIADEIVFHTISYHTKQEYTHTWIRNEYTEEGVFVGKSYTTEQRKYNNLNPGIAYRWDSGWEVGYYYNSYRNNTFYVAKEFMFTDSFGVVIGAGTGYDVRIESRKINFLGAFEYKHRLDDKWTSIIQFVPPVNLMDSSGLVHLAFSRKFEGLK